MFYFRTSHYGFPGSWERRARRDSGSRVPRNGKPARIPSSRSSSVKFLKRGTHSRFLVAQFSGTGTDTGFWVSRNGTRNWHPYTGHSTNNWQKLCGLLQIHSMDIHQYAKVQWTVANASPRTSANNCRKCYRWRAGTPFRQTYYLLKSDQWLMIILFILLDTLLTLFIVKLRKTVLTILLRDS
jgi:hypothetical protein